MKKYLFFLVAAAMFAACEDDVTRDPSPVTPENCQDVYFPADNPAYASLTTEDKELSIKVSRTIFTDEAIVPIRVSTTAPEYFVIPEAIHFAAGQEDAELKIGISDQIQLFMEYPISITVDEAYADYYTERPFGSAVYALKLVVSDWKKVAKGIMTCPLFTNPWYQDMEYSAIKKLYRFPEPWVAKEDFTFEWDGGDTFKPVGTKNGNLIQFYIGDHPQVGEAMYLLCAPECTYDKAHKTFIIPAIWHVANYGDQSEVVTTVEIIESYE